MRAFERDGLRPVDAAHASRRALGNVTLAVDDARDVWTFVTQDMNVMRYSSDAVRSLARTPSFAVIVILTLGVGIGASVTTYSVLQAVLWKSLPYPDADRLVLLDGESAGRGNRGLAPYEIRQIRERSRTIDAVAVVSGVSANLNIDGELERVFAVSANSEAFTLLGAAPPALGRLSDDNSDFAPNGFVNAVVISDSLWRRHLGTDPSVVGRHIQVNNLDVQIVGVLRPGLRLFLPAATNVAEEVDVWFPNGLSDRLDVRHPGVVARLAPGATLAQANAELATMTAGFIVEHPEHYSVGTRLFATPAQDLLTARVRPALTALATAVALVLLISCVNVTNLMLARAKTREREIAVCAALGASRARLVGQLIAESTLLAIAACAAGLTIGALGVELLEWLRPTHLPRQSQIAIDLPVAIFAVGLSIAVCLACSLSRRSESPVAHTSTLSARDGGALRLQACGVCSAAW